MSSSTIDRDSPVPAYYQIEIDLKKRIANHEWEVHQQVPSEAELAAQYGVSRITLRQALAELEKDGIIKKFRGKGAFVSSNPVPFIHDLSYVLLSGDRITQQGLSMTAELLELRLISDVFPNIQKQLAARPEDHAVYIKRLFLLDGKPIAIGRAWLLSRMVPDIEKLGLIENSISITLSQRYHLSPTRVEDLIEAVRPTSSETQLLKTVYDVPLILIKGQSYLEDNRPLEYSNTIWLGDSVRFHLTLQHTENGFVYEP